MGGGGSTNERREVVLPPEPDPIFLRSEEEREDPAAKRREIREKELKEQCRALMRREVFLPLKPLVFGSNIPPRPIILPYEPRPNFFPSALIIPFTMSGFEEEEEKDEKEEKQVEPFLWEEDERPNPEEIRPASPASSCESMRSDRSMDPPASFKPQKAGSPAPSCLSLKSDMSKESAPYFSNEPGPSDTKYRGINAGLWTQLNSMVSHLQEHISDCQNEMNMLKSFVRANKPEGQGESEEGVTCEGGSAEKRQQRGIPEDHTGLPVKN